MDVTFPYTCFLYTFYMLKTISILYGLHLFKFPFNSEVTKTKTKTIDDQDQKTDFLHRVKN